jgi:transcriptional regulator with XRE-family HTH domain
MLGKRLCQLREENRLTQKELAKHLGLTGRAIGYYEAEERCPAPDTLNKIADFFNVSVVRQTNLQAFRQDKLQ